MRDHKPKPFTEFNGLYARGRPESTPEDHLIDCLNIKFNQKGIESRDGFVQTTTTNSVMRMYVYKVFGQADRLLFLDNANSIWDSTNLGFGPILTLAGMTDFGFVNFFGRAYISPSNGITGLPGQSIYVYLGSGAAMLAGGLAPSGVSFTAVDSGSAGRIEKGLHLFAVVNETNTGFLTPLGPAIFASLTAIGGQGATISNIPLGPANIVARRIVATKIIPNYNGNQTGFQFFFVPNARIPDNTTTTFTVSFFDIELLSDASHLLNLFTNIPSGVGLGHYHGRLISWGENANPSVIRISFPGEPEAIDQVTGLVITDPADTADGLGDCQEYRDILYACKQTRTYSINDNGGLPSSWQTIIIDEGIGAHNHGIVRILDTGGVNIDKMMMIDHSGLIVFNGSYNRPEVSWKVRDLWQRINNAAFQTIQSAHDPILQIIYLCVPLDSAILPNHILICDYSNADPFAWNFYSKVRWAIWQLPAAHTPTSIICEQTSLGQPNIIRVGVKEGNVYTLTPGITNDFSTPIPAPFFQTALIGDEEGNVQHFAGARIRITGNGNLLTTFFSQDNASSQAARTIALSTAPGNEGLALVNFNAQRASIKCQVTQSDENFQLTRVVAFTKMLWTENPA